MPPKRKQTDALPTEQPAKQTKITLVQPTLSSRVVIEDLRRRNKRSKAPVGRHYIPGSSTPGRVLRGVGTSGINFNRSQVSTDHLGTSSFNVRSEYVDDFTNVVFEEILPPQRNRQVGCSGHCCFLSY